MKTGTGNTKNLKKSYGGFCEILMPGGFPPGIKG